MVFAILAILGGAAFWWWRLKMIGDAANDVTDVAGRAWGKYKRNKFRKKVEDSPLQSIEDPAAAAIVMMYAMAKEAGPVTEKVEAAIHTEVTNTMKIADAHEIVAFSKWAASHATDASNITLRYAKLWTGALNDGERRDFADMVERVAAAAGPIDGPTRAKLGKLRERLGLMG